jgi:hypothetical protein
LSLIVDDMEVLALKTESLLPMSSASRAYSSPVRDRQTAATRSVILKALGAELAAGSDEDLSAARLAERTGVPERTVYRHRQTREGLIDGLSEWYNERVADFPSLRAVGTGSQRRRGRAPSDFATAVAGDLPAPTCGRGDRVRTCAASEGVAPCTGSRLDR